MWLLVLNILAAGPAAPQGLPVAGEPPEVARARSLFSDAQRLFEAKKYRAAVALFEEAQAVRPHPSVVFNIARCRDLLGEVPTALRRYREYARLAPEAGNQEAVLEAISRLEKKLREGGSQQLTVWVRPAGAEIFINGVSRGAAPATVELPGGEYDIRVAAPGHLPETRRISHGLLRAHDEEFVLAPAPPPPPAAVRPAYREYSTTDALEDQGEGVGGPPAPNVTRTGP